MCVASSKEKAPEWVKGWLYAEEAGIIGKTVSLEEKAMSQQESEQELINLEQAWLEAMKRNDMATLEQLVGQEYTLTANGLPQSRLTRTQWMATIPVLDIYGYSFQRLVVQVYTDAAVRL